MLRTVMAAVGKVNPLAAEGPTSALGTGPRAQLRAFQTQSSPVYKTQSDTHLSGMKGANKANMGGSQIRRGLFSSNGNRPKVTSVQDVANFIKEDIFKNIVVVAGAGISTPSGIPDFRTPGTGLYDNLQQYKIPYPEAIFDIDYFHHNPKPFFVLAKELYPSGKYRPNYIHYFCRYLQERGVLLRMYTQNIDGLERLAGIPPEKLVEAHGTFSTATCVICRQKHDGSDLKEPIFSDRLPKCKKRGCPGIVKPDITFFGEDLPQQFYFYLKDMLQTDLVIVMGTSLEVQPFAGIVDTVKWDVPRILFNMHPVGPFRYHRRAQDFVSPGDLISSVQKFAASAGWKAELTELITKEEGSYVVCSPDYAKKAAEFKNKPPPRPAPDSIWRQRAQLDLYDSDSSVDSSDSESESDTSSEDDRRPRHRNRNGYSRSAPKSGQQRNYTKKPGQIGKAWMNGANGTTNNGRNNGGKPRKYSTEATMSARSDQSSTSIISRAGSVGKNNKELSKATSKLNALRLRSKSNTPDALKRTYKDPVPNRNKLEKNSKSGKSVQKKYIQRSSSVGAMKSEKEGKKKDTSLKHSASDSKLSKDHEGKNSNRDSGVIVNDIKRTDAPSEEKSAQISSFLNGSKQNNSIPPPSEENIESEDKSTQVTFLRKTKPPLPKPQNTVTVKQPLNTLNTRPYGYSQKRLPNRPSVPANLVEKGRLRYVNRELNPRPNSAELPKIAYRHRLQPSYDARIFAIRVPESSSESSLTLESSSESDCG